MASFFKQPDLKVFNTMSMQKEPFTTLVPGKVSMFVCGPTVQTYLHVGHARTYNFYDIVARYLSHLGYEVNFLMNVTDIDDRITQAAKDEGTDPMRLAEKFTKAFLEDMESLKIYTVTKYERVSNYVQETVSEVASLIRGGFGYNVDGTVYFDTSKFPDFGMLSHQTTSQLSLVPLELSVKKKHLLDFALWRPVELVPAGGTARGGEAPQVAHTGHGGDHDQFRRPVRYPRRSLRPHLSSPFSAEIAQAESLSRVKPSVKYWVHTALVNVTGDKMSKSAGNALTLREALKEYGPDTLRLYLLSKHYREDLDFDEKGLKQMHSVYTTMKENANSIEDRRATKARRRDSGKVLAPFYAYLNDDFDTPGAIAFIRKMLDDGASEKDQNQVELYYEALRITSNILGVNIFGRFR